MHFVDPIFLFYFLPLVLIGHALALAFRQNNSYPKAAKLFIFASTLVFYGFHEAWWSALLVFSLALDFFWARLIHSTANEKVRRLFLWLSIIQNLLIFGLFKYSRPVVALLESISPMMADSFPQVFENGNVPQFPAGLSFYLLESASFVFDVYRKEIYPPERILDFFSFVGAFPRLIAGPIVRYSQISEQFHDFRGVHLEKGFTYLLGGLFLKVCFGDHFGVFTQYAFNQGSSLDFLSAWIGAISFSMQLYFDFLGYSLMAMGLGHCLGFEYPTNFNRPYLSRSVSEFWRRWHITLGAWIRDYLFLPLALNLRKTPAGTFLSIMLSFLLLGLWHGPSLNMVLMGLWWGLWIWMEWRFIQERLPKYLAHILTLLVVLVGWVLFHSKNHVEAGQILKAMILPFRNTHRFNPEPFGIHPIATFFCVLGFVYCFWIEPKDLLKHKITIAFRVPALAFSLVLTLLCAYSSRLVPFLYFRF